VLRGVEDDSANTTVFQKGDEQSLEECMDDFWTADKSLTSVQIRSETTEVADAALQRLGEPPAELAAVHGPIAEYYTAFTDN